MTSAPMTDSVTGGLYWRRGRMRGGCLPVILHLEHGRVTMSSPSETVIDTAPGDVEVSRSRGNLVIRHGGRKYTLAGSGSPPSLPFTDAQVERLRAALAAGHQVWVLDTRSDTRLGYGVARDVPGASAHAKSGELAERWRTLLTDRGARRG